MGQTGEVRVNGFKIGTCKLGTSIVKKSESNGRHIIGDYFSNGYDKIRPTMTCPYCGKEFKKRSCEVKYELSIDSYEDGKTKIKNIEFCSWTCKSKYMKANQDKIHLKSLAKILGRCEREEGE